MHERYCKVCRGWHDLEKPWPVACSSHYESKRSGVPFPMLQRDWTEPVQHPVSGEFFTNKAAFSRRTKELGYTEVGDDPARFRKPEKPKESRREIKEAIARAENLVSQGFDPYRHTIPDTGV